MLTVSVKNNYINIFVKKYIERPLRLLPSLHKSFGGIIPGQSNCRGQMSVLGRRADVTSSSGGSTYLAIA